MFFKLHLLREGNTPTKQRQLQLNKFYTHQKVLGAEEKSVAVAPVAEVASI